MSIKHSGTRQVSLFVPELLSGFQFLKDLPKSEVPKLPALQLLLTRSSTTTDGFKNYYQGVSALLGIKNQQQDHPTAAITVAADKKLSRDDNKNYFIFAEPVVMKADRDSVVLLESLKPSVSDNSLSLDESKLLIDEINLHFSDEPWQLNITDQGDWYLILDSNHLITTTDIDDVLLNNAQDYMPIGDDARYWRKIINEIEMLFFSSSVNEHRVENNKPAVVSLWLWGGGQIPELVNPGIEYAVWGANSFLKSITNFLGVSYNSLNNQNVNELINACDFNYTVLVNSGLQISWKQRDLYSWITTLKKLEEIVFKPLLLNLRNNNLDLINIYPDSVNKITVTRRSVKQWWKPIKSLTALSSII